MTTELRRSACPLDCPDLCSLEVHVEQGRLVKLEGVADDPITQGFICRKVRHFDQHLYGSDRLLAPLKRIGPKGQAQFAEVSWDEALDEVARRFQQTARQHGGEAILPFYYGGSNGKLTHGSIDARLFRRLGASRLLTTVCAIPTSRVSAGMYGKMHGVALQDYVHARLIVIWGANPQASGIHLIPFIKLARQRGAKLVVVDPRRTPLAAQADQHLAIRPGSDVAVTLSILRWLFHTGACDREFLDRHCCEVQQLRERAEAWDFDAAAAVSGIRPEQLESFAALYAASDPAVIRCGWGLERNRNGGSSVAGVLALPAVAGKFGVRGGGYTMSNSAAWQLDTEAAVAADQPATRAVNMNRLGRALLEGDPPVRVLFVYNANPLVTVPHQTAVRRGLEREDLFTVVFDQVMTDTARYADIVLPATSFLEHDELRNGYGNSRLHRTRAVIDRVGQSRPNNEVFAELCQRLGLHQSTDAVTTEQLLERLIQPLAADQQASLRSVGSGRDGQDVDDVALLPNCGEAPVQFVDVFPATADQKVHLVPEDLDRQAPYGLYAYQPDPATAEYPLTLISPATAETISSTLGQLVSRAAQLEIHPLDAQQRSIDDGAQVRVYNSWGEVHCQARWNEGLAAGVVVLPKGLWCRHTSNGNTSNAVTPDTYTDIGDGACFNDARVQVARKDREEEA